MIKRTPPRQVAFAEDTSAALLVEVVTVPLLGCSQLGERPCQSLDPILDREVTSSHKYWD